MDRNKTSAFLPDRVGLVNFRPVSAFLPEHSLPNFTSSLALAQIVAVGSPVI
jgi:hypothetical protein